TENDACRFSSRKDLRPFERVIAAEQHLAEQTSQLLLGRAEIEAVQPFDYRDTFRNGLPMILCKIAHRDFVAPDHRSGIDRELLVGIVDETRRTAYQRFQERGLSRAVSSNE